MTQDDRPPLAGKQPAGNGPKQSPPTGGAEAEPVRLREPAHSAAPEAEAPAQAAQPSLQTGNEAPGKATGWEDIFEPGEVELWQGQPVPGLDWQFLHSKSARAGMIPLAVGLGWTLIVLAVVEPWLVKIGMSVFGLAIAYTGYFNTFGRVRREARLRETTWYTISSHALYIASTEAGQRRLDRYPLDQLTAEPILVDGQPGSVFFAKRDSGITYRSRSSHRVQTGQGTRSTSTRTDQRVIEDLGFHRIAEPREAFGLINRARAALLAGQPLQRR